MLVGEPEDARDICSVRRIRDPERFNFVNTGVGAVQDLGCFIKSKLTICFFPDLVLPCNIHLQLLFSIGLITRLFHLACVTNYTDNVTVSFIATSFTSVYEAAAINSLVSFESRALRVSVIHGPPPLY